MSALASPAADSPHAITQPSPGQLIEGKYRIEKQIGAGGMGSVHAAMHVQLKQRVAIKFLHADALSDSASIERFQREAHAAVRLRSEHVARVLDLGTLPSGAPYTVMEYLSGRDLAAVLAARGALPFQEAVEYVLQACEAVAEAHSNGIIHRDLKPSNLFLTQRVDGRPLVKVLDFGISKLSAELHQGAGSDAHLTRTSAIIGSPSYMSPEQLRSSKDVDARADIWSLGVILFELLAHRLPFQGESLTELTLRIAADPTPSIRQLMPDVPEALEQIIGRCLEKNRDLRYASVIDFVRDIEPFADPLTVSMAERLGRSIPSVPPGASSQPHALHPHVITPQYGSGPGRPPTAVAWSDTEMMPRAPAMAPERAPRSNMIGIPIAIAILFVGMGGTAAAVSYLTKTPGDRTARELPLPEERTHLPPVATGAPTTHEVPAAASGLPSSRMAISETAAVPSPRPPAPAVTHTRVEVGPKAGRPQAPGRVSDLPDDRK